jgi:hypothetical protein
MNGVTAQSLREKGMDYHLNWGASLGHLQELAGEYGKDYDTAIELWNDDVRESKIMATLLMPAERFPIDMAMQWIGQTKTQEIAEVAVMNLYQHLPYAKEMALRLIQNEDIMEQLHGYNIMSRLLTKNIVLTDEEYQLTDDCANKTVNQQDAPLSLRHAAYNTLMKMEK